MISTDLGRLIAKEQDEIRRINETHTRDLVAAEARIALLQEALAAVTPALDALAVKLQEAGLWPGQTEAGRPR